MKTADHLPAATAWNGDAPDFNPVVPATTGAAGRIFRPCGETMRRPFRRMAALVLAFAVAMPAVASAASPNQPGERFTGLVESLNAGSARRETIAAQIYNELRGENAGEMRAALKNGLFYGSLLIQLGVVESLSMQGDLRDLYDLDLALAINRRFEVRTTILRRLPAYQLWNNERSRLAYLRYVDEDQASVNASALARLRRPPLTRRGRLDPVQDRLRADIAGMAVKMFDPITASLAYVTDPLHGIEARDAIIYYVGSALGNDPNNWREVWRTLSSDMKLANAEEIEEIRLAALATLTDLAAEALPELTAGLTFLLSLDQPLVDQAVMRAMSSLCRNAYDEAVLVSDPEFRMADGPEENAWRQRRLASAARGAGFALDAALERLDADAPALVLAATDCVGAAGSYPPLIPDPDGGLAAKRAAAAANLSRIAMDPSSAATPRLAALKALGEIGARQAVEVVGEILASPYSAPEANRDGLDVAEASVAALVAVAAGGAEGSADARSRLLLLLSDERSFPSTKAGVPPTRMGFLVMWRLQRLAKTSEISLDADFWRKRLGW